MPKDLTFKEVCNFIRKDDSTLIGVVDKLLDVAILFSPVVFGAAALPALTLLKPKDNLTALGKTLLSKITSKREADYLARMHRMEIAYGLICYTAFFEALDSLLPDDLRKEIDLHPRDKEQITERATDAEAHCGEKQGADLHPEHAGPLEEPLPYPHPVVPLEDLMKSLAGLYEHMSNVLGEFFRKLVVREGPDDKKDARLRESIKTLAETALRFFEAQYFGGIPR